jgi:hypothetical protein
VKQKGNLRRVNGQKTNGHAGANGRANGAAANHRANGHAPAFTERGGTLSNAGHAASDDVSGASAAHAASSSAAGSDHEACAEVAPPSAPGGNSVQDDSPKPVLSGKPKREFIPHAETLAGSTDLEALVDGASFVSAVADRVDLVAASVRFVSSGDEKIAKAELDRLREMIFGKAGAGSPVQDIPTVIWDIPSMDAKSNES